jgi:hypothetical protein
MEILCIIEEQVRGMSSTRMKHEECRLLLRLMSRLSMVIIEQATKKG